MYIKFETKWSVTYILEQLDGVWLHCIKWEPGGWWQSKSALNQSKDVLFFRMASTQDNTKDVIEILAKYVGCNWNLANY